jgi:hypothetical protein
MKTDVELIDQLVDRRRLRDGDRDALVAAARLLVAIWRTDHTGPDATPAASPAVEYLGSVASKTLLAEVRFLCAVSKRLHSRFVREALAAVKAQAGQCSLADPVSAR